MPDIPKRRFFYDTEFIEHGHGDFVFGPTIDLISIGIVSEDGQHEFYGCNAGARFNHADQWVRDNVIDKLPEMSPTMLGAGIGAKSPPWYMPGPLSAAVLDFLAPSPNDPVELWAYYGAYDHVVFCWLFGKMVNLPAGLPMYTHDVKQLCDSLGDPPLPPKPQNAHDALVDAHWTREAWLALVNEK